MAENIILMTKQSHCKQLAAYFNDKEIKEFLVSLLKACLKSIKKNDLVHIKREIACWEATAEEIVIQKKKK